MPYPKIEVHPVVNSLMVLPERYKTENRKTVSWDSLRLPDALLQELLFCEKIVGVISAGNFIRRTTYTKMLIRRCFS